MLREGFGLPGVSEPEVDEAVRAAARAFGEMGAVVDDVSVPAHVDAASVWNVIAVSEATDLVSDDGARCAGDYVDELVEVHRHALREGAHTLPDTTRLVLLIGQCARAGDGPARYAEAHALRRRITDAYDAALAGVDLLLLPTTPQRATPIPAADAPLLERFIRCFEMTPNTTPFNLTGHPALSVPCALAGGLPVGMMLVGRRGDDATVLRAGDAFQRAAFPPPSPGDVPLAST